MRTTIRMFSLPVLAMALTVGCGQATTRPETEAKTDEQDHDRAGQAASAETVGAGDHSAWWCVEHGIPEDVCSMCNSKVAAEFQKKGDWCQEHDRADSQCFHCHPELESRFAKQFEARYGEQPPKPVE